MATLSPRQERSYSPCDVLLRSNSPGIASLRACHRGDEDITNGKRKSRNHGEEGEREGEDGELHDGREHGLRCGRRCGRTQWQSATQSWGTGAMRWFAGEAERHIRLIIHTAGYRRLGEIPRPIQPKSSAAPSPPPRRGTPMGHGHPGCPSHIGPSGQQCGPRLGFATKFKRCGSRMPGVVHLLWRASATVREPRW